MRWFYHLVRAEEIGWGSDGRYRPASLTKEGFIHASFRDEVKNSARLYFPPDIGASLKVLAIDPRRLDVRVDIATTPRGPMPHIEGAIAVDAVTKILSVTDFDEKLLPDRVVGTRVGLMAFEGMTLLDLVGPLDVLSRIHSMGFDPTMTCEVFALTRPASDQTVSEIATWTGSSASLRAGRYRPALDAFDVLVIPGGPSTQELIKDASVAAYVASYPTNRLIASVCTGAILLAVAGRLRGKRATTHASALDQLAGFEGVRVERAERVVDEGNILTSGGVTAGIDLGLHLVKRLEGDAVATSIADRIEWQR